MEHPVKTLDECQELLMDTNLICKGRIAQGPNKGKECTHKAAGEGYCKKHILNIIVEKAKSEGKRICDDGKRACKNYTDDGKIKCEECLVKIRESERKEHHKKKESGLCLGCGSEIITPITGFRKETVQRCERCYVKLREVEDSRERIRNYKQERKANISTHYQVYVKCASQRNKRFELSIEDFSELVNSRCSYCDYYDESEAIGVDRVDSSEGYISGNVVPCCAKCNIMKNDSSVDDFLAHIRKIYMHSVEGQITEPAAGAGCETASTTASGKSYIPPKKIMEKYRAGKLDDYIADCVTDERSPAFIDKMRELQMSTLNDVDTRAFIKSSLWSETVRKTLDDRQRINKKEMFGYLKLGNIDACVDHYSRVHGRPDGFRADMEALMDDLTETEFTRILVKYQNRRNS